MYYIAVNNERKGPFSIAELSQQGVGADTLVWKEGMTEWTALKNVAELQSLVPAPPPPPPPPPPAATPPPPPPPRAAAPPPPPSSGSTLETGAASEQTAILDSEMGQAAKETFSNMDLSAEGVFDFKSSTFSANRATIYALGTVGLLLIGSLISSNLNFLGFLGTLLSAVGFACAGLTWLEMNKLLVANGGRIGGNYFKWAGFLFFGVAVFTLILSFIILSLSNNPFNAFSMYGTINTITLLLGLVLIGVIVFSILAGLKIMNYQAKFFKELAYTLFASFPLAIILRMATGTTSFIGNFLGALFLAIPFFVAVMIFQRAGKNGGKVA